MNCSTQVNKQLTSHITNDSMSRRLQNLHNSRQIFNIGNELCRKVTKLTRHRSSRLNYFHNIDCVKSRPIEFPLHLTRSTFDNSFLMKIKLCSNSTPTYTLLSVFKMTHRLEIRPRFFQCKFSNGNVLINN